MKRAALFLVAFVSLVVTALRVFGETETIDLKALAKKARPAVMLLVVSDANGKEIATGTGFLVSSDGKLITNHHVIENAASAVAKAENGGLFPVEGVLADDPKNDLVLLKLKGKAESDETQPRRSAANFPFLTLSTDAAIEVGTRIAIIGSPLGLEGTMSEGIVSAIRELMSDIKVLQVTAAISPGSSGSPVLDTKGDVVGIASALLRGGQALNFAVPVEYGVRLVAKVNPSSVPQPLNQSANAGGEDNIFSDPDWRAACAAEAAGDDIEALKHDKVLVARYPDNAAAWYGLGCAFEKLNFTDDAIAAYRQAIKLKPDFADAWYNLGVMYGKSGRTDDEIAAYRQAIKIKPDDASAWANLGVAYSESGRTDDAIAAYRQAIKIKPDDANAWYNLGSAYGKSGRIDDAIAAYRQAIKLRPDYAEAWSNLATCYWQSERKADAIAACQQAVKLKPSDTNAWEKLTVMYAFNGESGKAREALRQLEKLDLERARKVSTALREYEKQYKPSSQTE